jgi:hypothetical protein
LYGDDGGGGKANDFNQGGFANVGIRDRDGDVGFLDE